MKAVAACCDLFALTLVVDDGCGSGGGGGALTSGGGDGVMAVVGAVKVGAKAAASSNCACCTAAMAVGVGVGVAELAPPSAGNSSVSSLKSRLAIALPCLAAAAWFLWR